MTRALKSSKLRQPGAAGVDHRRDADAEREAVGIDAVVAGVRAALAGAGVDVHVDVDEAGRDVQARDVDGLEARPPGSIFAATAAILPAAMATSRTALMLFFGSMTCPPRSSRSYFGRGGGRLPAAGGVACGDGGEPAAPAIEQHRHCAQESREHAHRQPRLPATWRFAVHVAARYSPMSSVPDISSPLHRAGEREADRVAVLFAEGAADPHGVAVDRAGEVAGHEVAAMGAVDVVAALPQVQARGSRCPPRR